MSEASRRAQRSDPPVLFALYLLAYLSVLIRLVLRSPSEGLVGTTVYALMTAFLVLSVTQVPLSRLWPPWTHIDLALQCAVVLGLFLTRPSIDYYGILCIGLAIIAGRDLEGRANVIWLAVSCVIVVAGLILAFGPGPSVPYAPVYIAACLLVGLYGRATRKSEQARERSERMASELEAANERLRAYSVQAERAAVAQERARLSRELHDAATQTVFSMHMTSEAARMALTQDPERVPALLDRLQELARGALAELRSLVHELRPVAMTDESLRSALERHAAVRERRDYLRLALAVEGEERGSAAVKEALLAAAVEALNNVVKHAGVGEADVRLSFEPAAAVLRVEDRGAGFDPAVRRSPESYGLLSMRERVEALQGTLSVRSSPGRGTTVDVRIPIAPEETEQ